LLNDRENILKALRDKPLKVFEIMRRANVLNEEACQSLLMKMRDEGLVKFDIHKGRWLIGSPVAFISPHVVEVEVDPDLKRAGLVRQIASIVR
jgi:DNA-binding IclR family transcriptional regulator